MDKKIRKILKKKKKFPKNLTKIKKQKSRKNLQYKQLSAPGAASDLS